MKIKRRSRLFTWNRLVLMGTAGILVCWLAWPSPSPRPSSPTERPAAGDTQVGSVVQQPKGGASLSTQLDIGSAAAALAKWAQLTDVAAKEYQAGIGAPDRGVADTAGRAAGVDGHDGPAAAASNPADEGSGSSSSSSSSSSEASGGDSSSSKGSSSSEASSGSGRDSSSTAATAEAAATGAGALPSAIVVDPKLRCPPLSEGLLRRRARSSTVMLGTLNAAQQEFGLNWLRHAAAAGLDYYLIAALDANTSALLASMQVPCFDYSDGEPKLGEGTEFGWGSEGWRLVTWKSVFIFDQVVDWGFNIIKTDMDVVWLRDPLPLFEKHPHGDILFSTDGCGTGNSAGDEGLEEQGNMHNNFNTGVYLLRNTPAAVKWMHAYRAFFDTFKGHDQEGAYAMMRKGDSQPHEAERRVTTAWDRGVWLGLFPSYLFANGHTYFVQRAHEKMGFQSPYVVHATWTYNGMAGKKARLRDSMLWHDDPAYYSEASFVTVDLQVAPAPADYNSWEENEDMIGFHLASIHRQLHQAYLGMALAAAAGRAFISPKFQCFCEKIWHAVIKCRLPDVQDMQFPVTCPTDYLFQPDHFTDDPDQFGTPLDYRESSFLDNPRTPDAVKGSVLVVRPSDSLDCRDCVKEEQPAEGASGAALTVLLVPAGLRDKELLPLLEPYRRYKVWRLSFEGVQQPSQAYGGFSCAGAAQAFDQRMEHITTDWCCRFEEDAAKRNKPVREQLIMSQEQLSAQPGLDLSC